jgi:hypothetical protein
VQTPRPRRADVVGGFEVLFDVELNRLDGDWSADHTGNAVLEQSDRGLRRTGKTLAVAPWPVKDLGAGTLDAVRRATGS